MKRFIAMTLVIIMLLAFAGCGAPDDGDLPEIIEGFVTIETLDTDYRDAHLVYDKGTKVMYIVTIGYYGAPSLCPYYDSDGNVAIYDGGYR